jgi:hypothetical protein
LVVADDRRACERLTGEIVAFVDPMDHPGSFRDEWWPSDDMDAGATLGVRGRASWGEVYPVSGANGRLALVGYTRDAYGAPLGGCTVKAFRTSDDSRQATVVSDANGLYTITTPFADGHYLIVYKAGPPDICGTTTNTLAPG